MFKKKNQHKALPPVSTASLPDIIFILLFFFMIVTNLRTGDEIMKIVVPRASQLTRLDNRSLVNYIYIGKSKNSSDSMNYIMQLGNKIGTVDDIAQYIEDHRSKIDPMQHYKIITSLKVDRSVPMKTVDEVKLALRKAKQLRLNYIADKEVVFE
jgi:biopolymer transport protein ExbD